MPTKSIPFASNDFPIANRANAILRGALDYISVSTPTNGAPFAATDGVYARLVNGVHVTQINHHSSFSDIQILPYEIAPMVQIHEFFTIIENSTLPPYQPVAYVTCPPIIFPEVTGHAKYYIIFNQSLNKTILINKIDLVVPPEVPSYKLILRGLEAESNLKLCGFSFGANVDMRLP